MAAEASQPRRTIQIGNVNIALFDREDAKELEEADHIVGKRRRLVPG